MPFSLPLDGVRVLELGGYVSAPHCGKLLADYGADVIKIEPPGGGDEARRMGPFAGDDPHPEKSVPFLYLNTNKRGVTLDIDTAAGAGLLDRLVETADVLVENHPPDARPSCLETESLQRRHLHLIVTSITPFGQTGPYRDFAATDIVTTAISGLMYHSGNSDQEPLRNALNQSFYVAGINAAVATSAALFQRMFTGRGQAIDVSTVECLASHLVQAVPYYSYMGAIKGRRPVAGLRIRGAHAGPRRVRDSVGAGLPALVNRGRAHRRAGAPGRAVRLRLRPHRVRRGDLRPADPGTGPVGPQSPASGLG